MFSLAISYLTASYLPWFMDLTSRFLCNIVLYSIRLHCHYQSCLQLGAVFLWLCLLVLSGVISSLFSSSILGTYQPGEFIFQCPIVLPFHTVHGVLKARIPKWFAISFPSLVDHVLSDLSTMTIPFGVALHSMARSFIELDKAVIHVISLVSFLWLRYHSVCPLMD